MNAAGRRTNARLCQRCSSTAAPPQTVRQRRGVRAHLMRPACARDRALCRDAGQRSPGIPLRFATALPLAGYGRGVIVTSVEGRPIKINGNPRHPASLGATDIFAEAAVLSLYDPDRSKAPIAPAAFSPGAHSKPHCCRTREAKCASRRRAGASDRARHIADVARSDRRAHAALPQAKWYRYEPVEDDAASAGALQAFGRAAGCLAALCRYAGRADA